MIEADELLAALRKAQDEIYTLMARDNFPRFTKTAAFEDFLQEVGSYDQGLTKLVSDTDLTMLVQDGEGAENDQLEA